MCVAKNLKEDKQGFVPPHVKEKKTTISINATKAKRSAPYSVKKNWCNFLVDAALNADILKTLPHYAFTTSMIKNLN
jgi:hypothetical protein